MVVALFLILKTETQNWTPYHRDDLGQFIFNGSAVPADTSKNHHSGTGRFVWLTMRTMSLSESGDSTKEISLEELIDNFVADDSSSNISKVFSEIGLFFFI